MPVRQRSIKAPRLHEMKFLPRTRHHHVQQPAPFVDLLGFAGEQPKLILAENPSSH
jgi:hypothetical protein